MYNKQLRPALSSSLQTLIRKSFFQRLVASVWGLCFLFSCQHERSLRFCVVKSSRGKVFIWLSALLTMTQRAHHMILAGLTRIEIEGCWLDLPTPMIRSG